MQLTLSDVQASYNGGWNTVLEIGAVAFPAGVNFITGKNGSGKTTLLRTLVGKQEEGIVRTRGSILLNGREYDGAGAGIVDQRPESSIIPELTFAENLLIAGLSGLSFLSLQPLVNSRKMAEVREGLGQYGLVGLLRALGTKKARMLSAGQQQLLAILMRLRRNHSLLLLDECTASLDAANTRLVLDTLDKLAQKGTIILFVTHQLELLERTNARRFHIEDRDVKKVACSEPAGEL